MELIIKLLECFQFVFKVTFRKNKSCYSEMICSWNLLKATSWNQGNSSILQDFKTIEKINNFSFFLCCFYSFLWKNNWREGIHSSLNFIGSDIDHGVEIFSDNFCSMFKWIKESSPFSKISISCLFCYVLKRRIDHTINHNLTQHIWAKIDWFQFNNLSNNVRIEVMNIEISTSKTTLSKKSFRCWMKWCKFTCIFDLWFHCFKYTSTWYKLCSFFIYIFTINLNNFKYTSSATTTNLFLTANSRTFSIVCLLKMDPVGFPGLMITNAFTFFPCLFDYAKDLYISCMSSCHPLSSSM